MTAISCILCLNGGSSSLKFSVYESAEPLKLLLSGELERMGTDHPGFTFSKAGSGEKIKVDMHAASMAGSVDFLISWLHAQEFFSRIQAIGHRIVHGMGHIKPEEVSPGLMKELHAISAFDPEHLPSEIYLIEQFQLHYPGIVQFACFDTSFHATIPLKAFMLPIPRRYLAMGIRRYGFHGLSYSYLLQEYSSLAGIEAGKGRIIIAHLGNGASLAAIKNGQSIDTTMGFTPGGGIPMSSRTGDLDPGLAFYFMNTGKLDAAQFSHLVNHESGLLGMSETSSDMRDLHESSAGDNRATEAVEVFCYGVKKQIGAYAAALGGLDTLIFSGGIGQNDPQVRAMVCEGLEFLGINIDPVSNQAGDYCISAKESKVSVFGMKTNEELMIARFVLALLKNSDKNTNG